MEEYVTLAEIYIHDSNLFKHKNLKSFIKTRNIQDHDMVKLKGNKIALLNSWVAKNLPSFNLQLQDTQSQSEGWYEVYPILEKNKVKQFNPITLNLDSSMVTYFYKESKRVPYFNYKGLVKIMMHFNNFDQNIFDWIHELQNGSLQPHVSNLHDITEMANLVCVPVIKNVNGVPALCERVFNVDMDDVVVDFRKLGKLKKEADLQKVIDEYKCPIYAQLQLDFEKRLKEGEKNFNNAIKELKQEKVIQHLQQQLDKEKSLKDQALSLTQSFIPNFEGQDLKHSPFGQGYISKPTNSTKLVPSKIQ